MVSKGQVCRVLAAKVLALLRTHTSHDIGTYWVIAQRLCLWKICTDAQKPFRLCTITCNLMTLELGDLAYLMYPTKNNKRPLEPIREKPILRLRCV